MPLPILHTTHEPTHEDLIRLYHRAKLHWARHLAEETALDVGAALVNAELSHVYDANRMHDAVLLEGLSPAQVQAQVDEHFRAAGSRCWAWVMNPSVPPGQNAPLEEHLLANGHRRVALDIFYLKGMPATPIRETGGLKIIPSRASYRHARELADQAARKWAEPQLAEAAMLHLDDPHTDALLALKDNLPAATVSVLAVGDVGAIMDLFVSEPFRRQGIGRTMMSRAMEICARSLFRHVFLHVAPENAAAIALYRSMGFNPIGQFVSYQRKAD